MKLLFDQNLSHRLVDALSDVFPGSEQVRRLGLDHADDQAVWRHAQLNGFALVTQDSDFADFSALRGAPPKVIWLRCGNLPNPAVEALLRRHAPVIETFGRDEESDCLEIV